MVAVTPDRHEERFMNSTTSTVYELVTDITQTGRWAQECEACHWLGGATAVLASTSVHGFHRCGPRRPRGVRTHGYRDPHKFFAFQPFHESSTWRADIVRVTWDGERLPVEGGWAGYDWNELVDTAVLQHPWRTRHAYMGVGATIDFLDQALDLSPPTPRTISTLDSWRPRSHRSRTHVARLSP